MSKGIKFHHISEDDAIYFLEHENYYVKLTAYKTNFPKHNNQSVKLKPGERHRM